MRRALAGSAELLPRDRELAAAMLRTGMDLLVNIDVPDLTEGVTFYTSAFDLVVARRLGPWAVELSGLSIPIYLLENPAGSIGAGDDRRRYHRHWTPVHLDVVVGDIEAAVNRALAAGAGAESDIRIHAWGKIATLSDPFGHGFCLIEFLGGGYDAIAIHAAES